MKRTPNIKILLLVFTAVISFHAKAQEILKAMSFNIRLDVASDGENRWELRKDKVASLMNNYEADFIGCQEVQYHQLQYLKSQLNGYSQIGVGRDDGKQSGEYSCIFYNNEKFKLIKQSTFWLSPTPDSVSRGWDAVCNRVCTYGLFKSNKSGCIFWVFNTHLDHMGVTARIESVKLIAARITQLNKQKNYPCIVTGDFNDSSSDATIEYFSSQLQNAASVSLQTPYGPPATWNGFDFLKKPAGCIDYVFISKGNQFKVKKFATITDSYNMKYPSDHFPVMATLEIKK